MKPEKYKVLVKDENGKIIDSKDTGMIYDAWIKATYIKSQFEHQYEGKNYTYEIVDG